MSKDATVYILDMNPSMGLKSGSKKSPFETLKLILQKLLMEKLISGRKGDQIGLILVGSKESCNRQLSERSDDEIEAGAYEGILDLNYSSNLKDPNIKNADLESPLHVASMDMMRAVQKLEPSKHGSGDFMDAIVIAIKMLISHCTSKSTGKSLKYNKKICIFTNGFGDGVSLFPTWCSDLVEPALDQVLKNEIASLVCGFDFNVDEDEKFLEGTPKSYLMKFVNRSDGFGQFITGEDALQAIYETNSKTSVRPTTTFRGDLTYGNVLENGDYALSIPIYVYMKTKISSIPIAKKAFYSFGSGVEKLYLDDSDITHDTVYFKSKDAVECENAADESDIFGDQVEREELVRGYRYGKHIVPFTDADELASALKTEKCMDIICFTPSSQIPRHCFMSNVLAVVPDPTSKVAAEKLAALSAAMQVKDHVAIVRYCRAEDSSPKLAVLSSNAKGYLYLNQIPFADDIRHWKFPPFDFLANEDVNAKSGMTSKCLPQKRRIDRVSSTRKHILDARKVSKSKAMEAIHNLINELDYSDQFDDLWPKKTGNIALEKVYDAIMKKALGDSFHGFGNNDSISIPLQKLKSIDSVCQGLQDAFELQVVPEKVYRGKIRKVLPSSITLENNIKETEVEFAFLNEMDLEDGKRVEKNVEAVDVDKQFEFLDF